MSATAIGGAIKHGLHIKPVIVIKVVIYHEQYSDLVVTVCIHISQLPKWDVFHGVSLSIY